MCGSSDDATLSPLVSCSEENRAKYHRRRPTLEDAAVDYVHDGNKKFNQKLAKAFDRYTTEIKENLERGTAV